jgi:hypothetical protein
MSVDFPNKTSSDRTRPKHVMRITCNAATAGSVITVTLERSGRTIAREAVPFFWQLSDRDKDDIRWYLEEYFEWQAEPAPRIAARIERRAIRLGHELFEATFPAGGPMRRFWRRAKGHAASLRVEIAADRELATVPWELLREPECAPVALQVASFVRLSPRTANVPLARRDRLRVLLVIARPRRTADVPFRSVAGQLVIAAANHKDVLSVDVLRPPTFDRLEGAVLEALRSGTPYDILHFDGHGEFVNQSGGRPDRGYLVFEHPTEANNKEFIDGTTLGKLLASAQVPATVLNACESAATTVAEGAYGAVADELLAAGLSNVVAMRYKVYVYTAATFVSQLYASLARGVQLDEAVTRSRNVLAIASVRPHSCGALPRLDWIVPVVYECAKGVGQHSPEEAGTDSRPAVPAVPLMVAEHFGREETLLEIDRAFDNCNAVLLHGFAGIGKSETAAAFARWYVDTHGASAVVISRVEPATELTAPQDHPLWIVDGIDRASASVMPSFLNLLRRAAAAGTKVLATARAGGMSWLGDTGAALVLPPMRIEEQMLLLEEIVTRGGGTAPNFALWRPALQFSSGIPGALVPIIAATLKKGNETEQSLARVLAEIRAGTAQLDTAPYFGMDAAFNDEERRQLGLLAWFERYVGRADLEYMSGRLQSLSSTVAPLSKEEAGTLLKRLEPLGAAHDIWQGSLFLLHPLLPWSCWRYLEQSARQEQQIFAETMAQAARQFHEATLAGDSSSFDMLARYEFNILRAFNMEAEQMAQSTSTWRHLHALITGLGTLYLRGGREIELLVIIARVRKLAGVPMPPEVQRVVLQLEAQAMRGTGQHLQSEEIEHQLVEQARTVLVEFPNDRRAALPPDISGRVRQLLIATLNYASTLRNRSDPSSVRCYFEALGWSRRLRDTGLEAEILLRLGELYASELGGIKQLRAEVLLRSSLQRQDKNNTIGRSKASLVLAEILYVRAQQLPNTEARCKLIDEAAENAETAYRDPPFGDQFGARVRLTLGSIYSLLPDRREKAIAILHEALEFAERAKSPNVAAEIRLKIAETMLLGGRLHDGLEFARTALRTFRARQDDTKIDDAARLVRRVEETLTRANDAPLNDWLNLVSNEYTIALWDDPIRVAGQSLAEQEELGRVSFVVEGYTIPIKVTIDRKRRTLDLYGSISLLGLSVPPGAICQAIAAHVKSGQPTKIMSSFADITLTLSCDLPRDKDFMKSFSEAIGKLDVNAKEFTEIVTRFGPSTH